MSLQSVTSRAPGPRMIWALVEGQQQAITLQPGESRDLELATPDHPTVLGLVESGELVLGAAGIVPPLPGEQMAIDVAAWQAKVDAAYDRGFAEGMVAAKRQGEPSAKPVG